MSIENHEETTEQKNMDICKEDLQVQQILELKELTRSLMQAVQSVQSQNARNLLFQEALSEIKATSNALLLAPTIVDHKKGKREEKQDPCGSPCNCTSTDCCTYDILLTHIRVLNMQIEPIDSNMDTIEVRLFA
jgi:hypothetical protein